MKRTVICLLCLTISVFLIIPAFAQDNTQETTQNLQNLDFYITLELSEAEEFFKSTSDYFADWAISAVEHIEEKYNAENKISLENVHSAKAFKLYGLNNADRILDALCETYERDGKIEKMISSDYSLIVMYVNDKNEYVDSVVFIGKEHYPQAQNRNGWVPVSSGGFAISDDIINEYIENGSFEKQIDYSKLKNIEDFKLISVPYVSVCIYFQMNNEEFIIPINNSKTAEIKAFNAYKVSSVIEGVIKPIRDFQNEEAKKHIVNEKGFLPSGTPLVPDNLQALEPVSLADLCNTAPQKTAEINNLNNELNKEEKPETNESSSLNIVYLIIAFVFVSGVAAKVIYSSSKKPSVQ